MKYYHSHGMGVNSEALRLEATRRDYPLGESVFVNHGGDDPRTYSFLDYLLNRNDKITVLYPEVEGYTNIYDFYFGKKLVPFIRYRSCTAKWKVRPQRAYYKSKGEPYTIYIGFDADEKHRVFESELKNVTIKFPLIEWKLHRRDCEKIVSDEHGENKPIKSGCYFCPRQPRESWWALARDQPELFWKAVALEENSSKIKLRPDCNLRDLWPPPATFEMVDMGCRYCVFGVDPIKIREV